MAVAKKQAWMALFPRHSIEKVIPSIDVNHVDG